MDFILYLPLHESPPTPYPGRRAGGRDVLFGSRPKPGVGQELPREDRERRHSTKGREAGPEPGNAERGRQAGHPPRLPGAQPSPLRPPEGAADPSRGEPRGAHRPGERPPRALDRLRQVLPGDKQPECGAARRDERRRHDPLRRAGQHQLRDLQQDQQLPDQHRVDQLAGRRRLDRLGLRRAGDLGSDHQPLLLRRGRCREQLGQPGGVRLQQDGVAEQRRRLLQVLDRLRRRSSPTTRSSATASSSR